MHLKAIFISCFLAFLSIQFLWIVNSTTHTAYSTENAVSNLDNRLESHTYLASCLGRPFHQCRQCCINRHGRGNPQSRFCKFKCERAFLG